MSKIDLTFQATAVLGDNERRIWRTLQVLLFIIGLGLFATLIFFPDIGVVAFWNVLIPVAPLLFLVAAGVWRNICPLASVAMLPHHFNFSKRQRIPIKWQNRLALISVVLFFVIVPARHLALNNDGLATAAALTFLGSLAFIGGLQFDVKSAWCSGLCPVHPVEKLYGQNVGYTPANAHCGACHNCVIPCPDSISKADTPKPRSLQDLATTLLTGGLPGFIWGWFHVPDCRSGIAGWGECLTAFGLPWATLVVTLVAYILLRKFLPKNRETMLTSVFAAASISCYYWYRIPSLFGYGIIPQDGILVDLTQTLPLWSIAVMQVSFVAFFGWWMLLRNNKPVAWAVRPPFLVKKK
ncbi:MAG: hypothetical protein K9J37_13450 [Saprospiraceae bacterium]|nr:hypothetical protein [Saprospiraceae bacterium]MCF8250914.1 hypothetical protein [Saprospiraceae bacterium]MCF8282700.1 hypothetical protein [Bacteroidales bacterium]MCF8311879.1 hypothetical protein [Saprospiraceae bacterium]MCF8441887.1 hypothetical protein [Saprospiraceae bacterium]